MSYILDALKKSDRSRQLNTTHTITVGPSMDDKSGAWKIWLLALGIFLATMLFLWWFWSFAQSKTPAETTGQVPTGQAPSKEAATTVSASGEGQTKQDIPNTGIQANNPRDNNVATAEPVSALSLNEIAARAKEKAVVQSPAERRSLESMLPKKEDVVVEPENLDIEPVRSTYLPEQTGQLDPDPVGTDATDLDSASQYDNYTSMRSQLSGLGDLHLDILAYHADAAQRRAYINMKKYIEGDQINGGAVVYEILPEGVVLDYQGRRFILTAK